MRYALIILALLFCTIKTDAQVYQAMPQAGYGPVKRMLIDSVLTIPIGISALRNITGGRDTAQIRYQKSDSSVYVYTGSSWVRLGTGGGGGGGSADSTVFFTVYRADTMRANIYGSIPQPDTIYARYPVRISNDTIYLQQAFVDSVYNVSSGDASRLVTTVYNETGSTITKGSVVYINGRHSSNLPTVALAQANDEANSYKTFALVETDIPTSNSGTVIQAGRINNLNLPTSTYTDGDILYLSPTVAGGYTTTKPQAPNHIVKLGSVVRAHPTLGGIEIKIENGWELAELSDVQIAAVPADSTLLQFSRVDSLWHDRTITQAIGPYLNAKANTASPVFTGSVGIGGSAAASALFEASSITQGILIPRMTTSQRNAISTPATGLMIWNTDDTTLHNYTGNTWRRMISANPSGTINYTAPTITSTTATPIMDLSQTWNNASLINTGFRMNITNTSSSSSSLLMDVQLNGSTTFNISRGGSVFSTNGFRNLNNTTGFINVTTSANDDNVFFFNATLNPTSLNKRIYTAINNFQPTSGSATYSAFYSAPTVNQTGSANGIVRGLHVSPTLTSAADFRGIDIENGSIVLPYATASATYTIKTSDYLLNFTSGTFTATLPTAVGATGKVYVLKNSGTGAVTIATTSSQTIDGATTYSLGSQYKFVHVVSNGSNWIITSSN